MILQLPPEILGLICELCTRHSYLCLDCTRDIYGSGNETWMTLRLVNKAFEEASTPFAFKRVRLRLFSQSLARFDELCHSNLARHIQAVDFHPDLLPVWDKQQWLSAVDYRPRFHEFMRSQSTSGSDYAFARIDAETRAAYEKLPKHSLSAVEIDTGWSAYEMRLQEQQRWRENPAALATMLKRLLVRLPNFQRTSVYHSHKMRHDCHAPFWEAFRRATRVHPEAWKYENFKADDFLRLAYVEALGLRGACLGVKQVTTLLLDLETREGFRILEDASDTVSGASTQYAPRLENLTKAFEPLTELTLCLSGADAYTRAGDSGQVHRLLRAARNMRTLDLTYGYYDDQMWDESGSPLTQFALMPFLSNPQVTYPHLEALSITAAVPAEVFSNFLELHAATLRRLNIWHSYSDDWKIVLLSIARHLKLNKRHLFELMDGCHVPIAANTWMINDQDCQHHFTWATIADQNFPVLPDKYVYQKHFAEAMEKFFNANGDEQLPQEYHDEPRNRTAAMAVAQH